MMAKAPSLSVTGLLAGRPSMRRQAALALAVCATLTFSVLTATAPNAQATRVTAPEIPTAAEIESAKKDEASKSAEITKIEAILSTEQDQLQQVAAKSYDATNRYNTALETLTTRQADAQNAQAKADAAAAQYKTAQAEVGALAGAIYKTSGVDPSVQAILDGNSLYRASTLKAISKNRSQKLKDAETAEKTATALQESAQQAQNAADEAANETETAKTSVETAYQEQNSAFQETQKRRDTLIAQLANLKDTTVELEAARVTALEQQAAQERLAQITAASAASPAPAPPQNIPSSPPPSTQPPGSGPSAVPAPPPAVEPPSIPAPVPAPAPRPAPAPAPRPTPAPPPPPASAPSSGVNIAGMVSFAMSKVGSPYVWGGNGPGYDCSGLIMAAFSSVGVSIPRGGSAQFWNAPQRVPFSQAQYGDILAFNNDGAGNFTHVGIYLGNNKMVNALNPSQGVLVVDLNYLVGLQLYPYAARY